MSDRQLTALAEEAGLLVRWSDAKGHGQNVAPDTLRSVLCALDLPANSPAQIRESRAALRLMRENIPPLIVARAGEQISVPHFRRGELVLDTGERVSVRPRGRDAASEFRAPNQVGYHRLECDGVERGLAVAPPRCVRLEDVCPKRRWCGISAQIYSLRGGTTCAFGDFAALGAFAKAAGRLGFDAAMTSPAHALFGAEPGRFVPYSPSTRFFLNPLYADATLERVPAGENDSEADDLIDWARAGPAKASALRSAFQRFRQSGATREFESFCRQGGERLAAHALFEALDAHFRAKGIRGFKNWPGGFESPHAPGVRVFASAARRELEFQLFLQWLTDGSASRAQRAARQTMSIGIIADIAVGMDPEGSHAWSAPNELLRGLHVGAPPDAFNRHGQDWGLTTLSPRALELSGFASFVATLRAGMRHAGGVRIDHAMGLRRLWVIPAGASAVDGVYLHYPQDKLLKLLALESLRHRAIVIGEDLGTVPAGFRDTIAAAGILGMQVLWFERDAAGRFLPPANWRRDAIATTTTHDLPTVAGWWSEHDLDLHKKAGLMHGAERELRRERAADRANLWTAMRRARCASGERPGREYAAGVRAAALRYVTRTRSSIAFAPLEDLAGGLDQPNLPGTTDEHPNWRRRVKDEHVLRKKVVRARIKEFVDSRRPR